MADEVQKYLIVFKGDATDVSNAIKTVKSGLGQISNAQISLTKTTDNHAKSNKNLEHSFIELVKRATYVIPVWLALRSAYTALLGTISGGFNDWVKYEEELLRVRNVTREFGQDTDLVMSKLTNTIKQMSVDTGKSMSDLAFSFYRFKTIGKTYEESLAGMDAVTKATIVFQGEQKEIAEFLSTSYNILGKTVTEVATPVEKMNLMMAKLNKLDETNDFLIGEMVESMRKFLPVAQNMNLTFDQTISLLSALHTGAIKSGRSGTLLATSFQQFMSNLGQVASVIGVYVDANNSPFQNLLTVLTALDEIAKSGNISKYEKGLDQIFGGVRGSMPIRDFVAVIDVLRDNLEKTSISSGKLMESYSQKLKENMESLPRQLDRFVNLRNLVGQAFVQGVTGGKDFEDSLVKINKAMANLIPQTRVWGGVLKEILGVFGDIYNALEDITDGFGNKRNLSLKTQQAQDLTYLDQGRKGNLNSVQLRQLIDGIKNEDKQITSKIEHYSNVSPYNYQLQFSSGIKNEKNRYGRLSDYLKKNYSTDQYNQIITSLETQLKIQKGQASPFRWGQNQPTIAQTKTDTESQKTNANQFEISQSMETKLKLLDQELKYIQMEAEGYNDIVISQQKLKDYVSQNVIQANKIFALSKGQRNQLSDQEILTMVLQKNWTGIGKAFQGAFSDEEVEQKLQDIANLSADIAKEQLKYTEARRKERIESLQIIAFNQQELENIKLRIAGYNEMQIKEKELKDYVSEIVKEQNILAKLSNGRISSLSEEEILVMAQNNQWDKLISKFQDAEISQNKLVAINERLNDIYEARLKIIADYSESLRSEVQSNLTDFMMSKSTGSEVLTNVSDFTKEKTFDAISGQVSDVLVSKSGLGNIFGGMLTELRYGDNPLSKGVIDGCEQGGKILYQYITSAMTGSPVAGVGVSNSVSGLLTQGMGMMGNTGLSPFNLGGVANNANWKTNPTFVNAPTNGLLTSGANSAGMLSGLSLGNLAGGAVLGGLTGYSVYQQAKNNGANQGTSLASGIMSGVGFGGIGALMASGAGMALFAHPVGWVLGGLALGGMALGLFGGKNKKSRDIQIQTQTETQQVASKIDITNKQLEIVNRNLVGLKQVITYALPSSAYLSEKTNIEDEFSLSSRRGIK